MHTLLLQTSGRNAQFVLYPVSLGIPICLVVSAGFPEFKGKAILGKFWWISLRDIDLPANLSALLPQTSSPSWGIFITSLHLLPFPQLDLATEGSTSAAISLPEVSSSSRTQSGILNVL